MSILSNWLAKATPRFFPSPVLAESKKDLHIEFVEPKDWGVVERKAQKWTWQAYKKAAELPANSQARAQLTDCGFICDTVKSHIQDTDPASRGSSENIKTCKVGPKELYVCKDKAGKIHGIALAEKNRTSLLGKLLVTRPDNIPTGQKDPRNVKGVGTTFLHYAQEVGPQRGLKNILLVNSDSSVPFYRKKGFSKIDGSSGYTMHKSIQPTSKL